MGKMSRKRQVKNVMFLFLAVLHLFNFEHVNAQTISESEPSFMVACSSEKQIASWNESIRLQAWVDALPEQKLIYTWSTEVGHLEGEGAEVQWALTGVHWGKVYKATVKVSDQVKQFAECSLRIIVTSPPLILKGGGLETGRAFLLPDHKEEEGYGLYS